MSNTKQPKVTHEGVLTINEVGLNVAVLNTGQRIISQSSVFKAFGRTKRGRAKDDLRVEHRPAFIDAKNLQKFVNEDVEEVLRLIEYKDKKGKILSGYDANILPSICKVYLDAREAKELAKNQQPLARASEVLLLGLSKIGIIALVDEVTGYQYDRERQELQKILKAYISDKLLPWQKRFPNDFYKEIFRLNGWDFTIGDIKRRPGVIGKWTNRIIYDQLPKGVLEELKRLTPKDEKGRRKHRFHQHLTTNIGHPSLSNQLASVVTIMRLSKDWKDFERKFNQLYGQTELDFGDDEQEPSKFNKNLMAAIENRPKKSTE